MHTSKLFYNAFVLFLSLTGCYAGLGPLQNRDFYTENQQPDEKDRIIPSYTTIYEAIKNKELEKAITLLQEALKDDKGVDLMQVDGQGRSLLHVAIANANTDLSQEALYLEIVRLLIKLKQDVNARDKEENTPLHIAASKGLFFVADCLVGSGATIYVENKQGETPLHCAAKQENIEVVGLLIDRNKIVEKTMMPFMLTEKAVSYIDKKDNQGRTPLYLAMYEFRLCTNNPSLGNPEKYVCIVNLLIKTGADVHTEDKYGTTLLHLAAKDGCVEMVRMLLQEKVKLNSSDENGNSPLGLAVCCQSGSDRAKDYLKVMNMLIEAGANVHHVNKNNFNLLHIAALYGNVGFVKLLINYKVEINSKEKAGYTPLHIAVANSASNNAKILEEKCYLEVVDLLIQTGAMINVENDEGHTPLQLAIKKGSDQVAFLLIKKGANNSYLLLHEAIEATAADYPFRKDACIGIIKYLISLGVGINNVDDEGNTPLHLAVKNLYIPEFKEVINLLVEAGADIYAVNKEGNTPFFYMKNYIRQVLL